MTGTGLTAPAPPSDPGADIFHDLGTRLDPDWFLLALLVPIAVMVFWIGSRLFRRELGINAMEPKGRPFREWSAEGDPAWRATMARLEGRAVGEIATAPAGPVRFEGVLVSSNGSLGGHPQHACVWRNRAGGHPRSAVAAELVVLADATGRCGIENLERARVIAPTEKTTVHHESTSLYLGDRIEVMGTFEHDRVGDDPDPTQNVYGTVGTKGPINIRVIERPAAATESTSKPTSERTESNDEQVEHADDRRPDSGGVQEEGR